MNVLTAFGSVDGRRKCSDSVEKFGRIRDSQRFKKVG